MIPTGIGKVFGAHIEWEAALNGENIANLPAPNYLLVKLTI